MRNSLSIFLVFCLPNLHLFADTYVWEDYDDFSGSSLDTNKWDVGYWGGGESVTIVNGQAQLSGAAYSSNSQTQVPSDIAAAASGSTEGNTFLFFKEVGIHGIQADISIPSQTNEYDAGIYLASLDTNPLGSLGAELRYRTSGSVLLFDYLESGNELEHLENGSLDTFYQLQIIKVVGKTSHYLNRYLIKQFESSSHDEDYWTIGAFNDAGLAYTTYADNVRVLRRATTTSLDGSTYSLSSSDGVSETLVFANGTFTSTFTDPEEGEIVTTDQSYILDQISEDEFRIILGDGDTMEFNTATNSGKLTDYDSSGQIDTSGTWDFTFEAISTSTQSYAPSSIAGRTITYTGNGETETASFSADGNVSDGEDWTYYEYEKTSDNVGVVTYTFANETNPAPEVETLTFTSSSGGTYDWVEYSDATMSTKTDNGSGTFSLSDAPNEPESVPVVSDPNGLPVVVQVGEDYQWNDTLDGVTLWGVGYDNEELITFTFSYSASEVEAVLGLVGQVTNPLVSQAYTITEEGYLEHTESSGPQYFKVHSVEDGKIMTTPFQDKSEASSSTDPHDTFFTTRAAAQEFYNSKINYAPESLDGLSIRIHDLETVAWE